MSKVNVGITYSVIVTLLMQSFHLSFIGLLPVIVLSPFQLAYAQDTLLERTKKKYQTDNPYSNETDNKKLNEVLKKYKDKGSSGVDLEGKIISRYYLTPSTQSQLDLSKYEKPDRDFNAVFSDSLDIARGVASNVELPALGENGGINTRYNPKGVALTKDENGNYSATLDQSGVINVGIKKDEFASSEINHADTTFTANEHYGDESAFFQSGKAKISSLKTGKTSDAIAYQTLLESNESNPATEINPRGAMLDFGFDEVDKAIKGQDEWFSACTDTTVTRAKDIHYSAWEYHQCMEPKKNNDFYCEVEREYNVTQLIESYAGNGIISSCGSDCVDIEFGEYKKTTKKKNQCWDEQFDAHVKFSSDIELDSATVSYRIEDHAKLSINNSEVWSVIKGVNGVGGALPDKDNGCMQEPTYEGYYKGNIEQELVNVFNEENNSASFNFTVRYGHEGEAYMKIRLKFSNPNGDAIGVKYTQTPAGCYDAVTQEIKDARGLNSASNSSSNTSSEPSQQECTTTYNEFGGKHVRCKVIESENSNNESSSTTGMFGGGIPQDTTEHEYSLCRFDSYSIIDQGSRGLPDNILGQIPPFFNGDTGNKTWKVNLDGYKCDPLGGQNYCIINKRGEQECFTFEDIQALPDQCAKYEEDNQCVEVTRTCAEGWEFAQDGSSAECFASTVEYKCDVGNTYTIESESSSNSCESSLPCVGGDCDFGTNEENGQFAEAMAMASALQYMEDDMTCDDPSDLASCRIFGGEGKFCTWEPSGLGNDCCESPDGIDIFEYTEAAYAMLQADAYVAGMTTTNSAIGAYQSLREPIADGLSASGDVLASAWETVSKPITDVMTNATGTAAGDVLTDTGVEEVTGEGVMAQLGQSGMNFVAKTLPKDLSKILFTKGKDGAADYILTEGASTALSVVKYAYSAYMAYQYIKLAMQLLTQCHEYEQDIGLKIGMRQCIPVDKKYCHTRVLGVCMERRQDYCCYDSILARIVMEQASPLLGHDLTDYTGQVIDDSNIRACPGLTPEQLAALDWDRIDLGEWVNTMIESGIINTDTSENTLTGSGRMINSELRQTTTVRTLERFDGVNLGDRAIEAKKAITADKVDCSIVPRPSSCYLIEND